MKKRILALFLSISMLLSMLPLTALAEGESVEGAAETVVETIPAETVLQTEPVETTVQTEPEETVAQTEPEETREPETIPEETTEATEATESTEAVLETVTEENQDGTDEPTVIWETIPFRQNPEYVGLIDPSILDIPEIPSTYSDNLDYALSDEGYVSEAEAAVQLREGMRNRQGTIQVSIFTTQSDFNTVCNNLVDTALIHTGKPTEGDYLERQYGGAGFSAAHLTDGAGGHYYKITGQFTYYTTLAQEEQMGMRVSELLYELDLWDKSDYQKAKGIYDYICKNVRYDYDHVNDDTYYLQYTAYAALMNGVAVCQGYATLLYRLALELGLDSRYIRGFASGGNHGWNILRVDGKYYNADATWDAGESYYSYFLLAPGFSGHTRREEYETAEFHAQYPMASGRYVPPVDVKGDVNGDGKVTSGDALLLAKYLVHLTNLSEKQQKLAEVTGDGLITNADLVKLSRYLVQAISEL